MRVQAPQGSLEVIKVQEALTNGSMSAPIDYRGTHFITSAAAIHQLPSQTGVEIALVGRSNAGKSSALNALTGQKNLARTSKTPGRTQLINLFRVVEGAYLVDLPGYGYAEAPEAVRKTWQQTCFTYLRQRPQLRAIIVLMDVRHPLRVLDQSMIRWALGRSLPAILLLTKVDKLGYGARQAQLSSVQEKVRDFRGEIEVLGFSSLRRLGIEQLHKRLDNWFLTP